MYYFMSVKSCTTHITVLHYYILHVSNRMCRIHLARFVVSENNIPIQLPKDSTRWDDWDGHNFRSLTVDIWKFISTLNSLNKTRLVYVCKAFSRNVAKMLFSTMY